MTLYEAQNIIDTKLVSHDYPKNKTFIDLSGTDINYIHVIKYAGRDKFHMSYFLCQCVCGQYMVSSGYDLRHNLKSCGCKNSEYYTVITKHGDSTRNKKHKLYYIWIDFRSKCNNPTHHKYQKYGGNGITVCDEWNNPDTGYLSFKEWAYNNGYDDENKFALHRHNSND